jgi:hypothetical protein
MTITGAPEEGTLKSWLLDCWTLEMAAVWIDTRDDDIVTVERSCEAAALSELTYALADGFLRSSGEVDGAQRRDLGIDIWIDYLIRRGSSNDIEVKSRRNYPASQVQNKVSPTADTQWHEIVEDLNGERNSDAARSGASPDDTGRRYHRTIENVLVSIEDVKSVWPPENISNLTAGRASPRSPTEVVPPNSPTSAATNWKPHPDDELSDEILAGFSELAWKVFPGGKVAAILTETKRNEVIRSAVGGHEELHRLFDKKVIQRFFRFYAAGFPPRDWVEANLASK